jgi:hypothetical protein
MTTKVELIRVFVSSPAELKDERVRLEEVVRELNTAWGDKLGMRVELVEWETHAYPGISSDAQAVIEEEIGDRYDIFIGLLWVRFGTPTKNAGSGTQQEFEKAYARFHAAPGQVRIMFYFKEAPVSPGDLDISQLSQVRQFRQKLGELGTLYWTYRTADEFVNVVRVHLAQHLQSMCKEWGTQTAPATAIVTSAESHEDALGFLDLLELGEDSFQDLVEVAERISHAMETLTERLGVRTRETGDAAALDRSSKIRQYKRISNRLADDVQDFVSRMDPEVTLFARLYATGTDSFARSASMFVEFGGDQSENILAALTSIRALRQSITKPRQMIVSFRDTMRNSPSVTTSFIKARNNAAAVLDRLAYEFDKASQQTENLETLLEGMLKK